MDRAKEYIDDYVLSRQNEGLDHSDLSNISEEIEDVIEQIAAAYRINDFVALGLIFKQCIEKSLEADAKSCYKHETGVELYD